MEQRPIEQISNDQLLLERRLAYAEGQVAALSKPSGESFNFKDLREMINDWAPMAMQFWQAAQQNKQQQAQQAEPPPSPTQGRYFPPAEPEPPQRQKVEVVVDYPGLFEFLFHHMETTAKPFIGQELIDAAKDNRETIIQVMEKEMPAFIQLTNG